MQAHIGFTNSGEIALIKIMIIRKLANSDGAALENFLSGHAETSMFLRSNMRRVGLEYREENYCGEYIGAFAPDGRIIGVIAHYWNGNIMMQAPDSNVLAQLIAALQATMTRPIAGIVGNDAQAAIIITKLGLEGAEFKLNVSEELYALELSDLKIPDRIDPARCRVVPTHDVDENILRRWIRAYDIEALKAEDNAELDGEVEKFITRIRKDGNCWVLLLDGVPVCLSGFNATLPDIVQIGPVWTPPEYRGRGYARTLLALTLQQAKAGGVAKSILFTDLPDASKAYRAIGFEKIGHYRLALLKQPVTLGS